MWGRSSKGDRPPGVCPENQLPAGGADDHGAICMKPPKVYSVRKNQGYSRCFACEKWRFNMIFFHGGMHLVLCKFDYTDYWENTDELLSDYKGYP